MNPLVTVIVPVYDVEDYLERCLDSLCKQSLQDVEFILVNDDSPDRCGIICEEYAAKDTRFRVYRHEENRGISAARNTGIKNASADYLMFVDGDDWVHEDFCKASYECAVTYQADLVMFNYSRVRKQRFYNISDNEGVKLSSEGYKAQMDAIDLIFTRIGDSACNKLYRKSLFKDISFPEGYYYEDSGTTYKTVLKAFRIYYLNRILYYYSFREGSITTLRNRKQFCDWVTMKMQFYHDLSVWGYPAEKLHNLLISIAMGYCIKRKKDITDSEYAFFAQTLYSCKTAPDIFTWKRKVLFYLFKYCPPLFEFACSLFGKRYSV